IARHLIETTQSLTLFATHYFELTQLPQLHPSAVNVHLSAVEHKDNIVFLHAVEAGPASQSYGLQVAQLAGVPPTVIRAARRHLATLEAHSVQASPQLDLFAVADAAEPPEPAPEAFARNALTDALAGIEPDAMTPREALDALYRLKQLADV
ncbi:MAG: DNA mismatch repair protein MutS, partial [Oxalobacteraceae bacterium]